ncbi:MAG: hypothetical protein ABI919_01440 [Ramlibacter sp.]
MGAFPADTFPPGTVTPGADAGLAEDAEDAEGAEDAEDAEGAGGAAGAGGAPLMTVATWPSAQGLSLKAVLPSAPVHLWMAAWAPFEMANSRHNASKARGARR